MGKISHDWAICLLGLWIFLQQQRTSECFPTCFLILRCLCHLKSWYICLHRGTEEGRATEGVGAETALLICTLYKPFWCEICQIHSVLLHCFIYIYFNLCLFSFPCLLPLSFPSLPSSYCLLLYFPACRMRAWAVLVGPYGARQEVGGLLGTPDPLARVAAFWFLACNFLALGRGMGLGHSLLRTLCD